LGVARLVVPHDAALGAASLPSRTLATVRELALLLRACVRLRWWAWSIPTPWRWPWSGWPVRWRSVTPGPR